MHAYIDCLHYTARLAAVVNPVLWNENMNELAQIIQDRLRTKSRVLRMLARTESSNLFLS